MPRDSLASAEDRLWTSPRVVKQELREHGVRPLKRRGQHFLVSTRVAKEIVNACSIVPRECILEIGAGLGALTIPLSWTGATVYAVEIDHALAEILAQKLSGSPTVTVLEEDFLEIDLSRFLHGSGKITVLGNLPYYASTDIIVKLMRERNALSRAILTLQREYADRLRALPGSAHYGSLSVFVSLYADVKKLLSVPPEAFYPKPKVGSQTVSLVFLNEPRIALRDEREFEKMVRGIFSERRKMILNTLSKTAALPKDVARGILSDCGISPEARPEELTLEELAVLSNRLVAT